MYIFAVCYLRNWDLMPFTLQYYIQGISLSFTFTVIIMVITCTCTIKFSCTSPAHT